MGLMEKLREQATTVAEKAQEAGRAGQARVSEMQSRRRADAMLRDVGVAVFRERTAGVPSSAEVERLIGELRALEAETGIDVLGGPGGPDDVDPNGEFGLNDA